MTTTKLNHRSQSLSQKRNRSLNQKNLKRKKNLLKKNQNQRWLSLNRKLKKNRSQKRFDI